MKNSPSTIQSCLRQHPGIADVAVIRVPDYMAWEGANAFVVPSKQPVPGGFPAKAEEEVARLFEALMKHIGGRLPESY